MSEIDYKTAYETTNEIVNLYYARIKRNEDEIERLNNIIKEVREYIKDNVAVYAFNNKDLPHWEFNDDNVKELLEILKGSEQE